MAEGNKFRLQIISPTRIFYEDDIDMAEMRTTEGEIGVLAGHIPLTVILEPGVFRIKKDGEVKEAAMHDGFVQIKQTEVTVLAESCEWPEEIDIKRAEEAKIRAERRISGGSSATDMVRAEAALKKAILRLDMAKK